MEDIVCLNCIGGDLQREIKVTWFFMSRARDSKCHMSRVQEYKCHTCGWIQEASVIDKLLNMEDPDYDLNK